MNWLTQLPGVFAIIVSGCTVVGGIIGSIISNQANKKTDKAREDAHKSTVEALKEMAATQTKAAELHLNQIMEEHKAHVLKLENERDVNRQAAHDIRNELGAKLKTAEMEVQELKLKPDLSILLKASENLVTTVSKLAENFQAHDQKVTDRMIPIYQSLEKIGLGIEELLQRTEPRKFKKKAPTPNGNV